MPSASSDAVASDTGSTAPGELRDNNRAKRFTGGPNRSPSRSCTLPECNATRTRIPPGTRQLRSLSTRWISAATLAEAAAFSKVAIMPSPVCLNTRPLAATIAAFTSSSCATRSTAISDSCSAHNRVGLPAMSVTDNDRVPPCTTQT